MTSIEVDEHIKLRSFDESDASALFHVLNSNLAHLRPWLNWVDTIKSEKDAQQFLRTENRKMTQQTGLFLGIFFDQHLVGGLHMTDYEWELQRVRIGFWIAKKQEGRGIVTKSVAAFLTFLFNRLHLNKVEILFAASNHKSRAVANKTGAKVEAVIRGGCRRNGQLEDLIITGILRSEWLTSG